MQPVRPGPGPLAQRTAWAGPSAKMPVLAQATLQVLVLVLVLVPARVQQQVQVQVQVQVPV